MDELIKIIIGVSGTVIGGFLGYFLRLFIEHRLAITRIKENIRITEFNKAAAKFRSAFAPALAFIYLAKKHGSTKEIPDVNKFLREALLCHASAIEDFRIFVPKSKGTIYQEIWEKYRYEVWNYGFETTTFRTDINDPWKVFEDLIHNILQFADENN